MITSPDLPVILLFGASEDKDIEGMFTELLPRVREVVATESTHPRACKATEPGELAHAHGVKSKRGASPGRRSGKGNTIGGWRSGRDRSRQRFYRRRHQRIFYKEERIRSRMLKFLVWKNMKEIPWPQFKDNQEDLPSALYQRTEELYQIPDAAIGNDGLIELPALILQGCGHFPPHGRTGFYFTGS